MVLRLVCINSKGLRVWYYIDCSSCTKLSFEYEHLISVCISCTGGIVWTSVKASPSLRYYTSHLTLLFGIEIPVYLKRNVNFVVCSALVTWLISSYTVCIIIWPDFDDDMLFFPVISTAYRSRLLKCTAPCWQWYASIFISPLNLQLIKAVSSEVFSALLQLCRH